MVDMYKRSPFVSFYWDKANNFIAFNCNVFTEVLIKKEIIFLLGCLSEWTTLKDLCRQFPEYEELVIRKTLDRLVQLRLVVTYPPGPEDELPSGTYWSNIDLAMQRQTSYGGYDPETHSSQDSPPAFKPYLKGQIIQLAKIELDSNVQFQEVLANRRTVRTYGSSMLTFEQISQFLYSSAGVQSVCKDPGLGEISRRPYPSGGARHPLEIYPICNEVSGLNKGVYYYDPLHHTLVLLKPADDHQERINQQVRYSTIPSINKDPAVVFLITACFARTMWKYKNIGLSTILKDVGCLYQTMYLVATAMELAPCAIGGGMEWENSHWLGLNSLKESQVGCFILGTKTRNSEGDPCDESTA